MNLLLGLSGVIWEKKPLDLGTISQLSVEERGSFLLIHEINRPSLFILCSEPELEDQEGEKAWGHKQRKWIGKGKKGVHTKPIHLLDPSIYSDYSPITNWGTRRPFNTRTKRNSRWRYREMACKSIKWELRNPSSFHSSWALEKDFDL